MLPDPWSLASTDLRREALRQIVVVTHFFDSIK